MQAPNPAVASGRSGAAPGSARGDVATDAALVRPGFGALLRERRAAAGLSRAELARRARLSPSTIKLLETTEQAPSRRSLSRLVGVAALKLVRGEAAPEIDEAEAVLRGPLDFSPGFDWLRLLAERDQQLRGAGGYIRQSLLCLDPSSAADCCRLLAGWPAAVELRSSLPLSALARRVAAELGSRPLQLLVLGASDGRIAARLARELLAEAAAPRLELRLCDLSPPLLWMALRRIREVLPPQPRLRLSALAGELTELGLQPLARRPHEVRLFALLAGTLADLDDEACFLRYGLPGAAPGDLLLLDFEAPLLQPDEPRAAGPNPCSLPAPPRMLTDWLAGVLWRARRELAPLSWHLAPEPHRALLASHVVSVVATVRSRDRGEQRFVLYQIKRYDPELLAASLERWGWLPISQLRYGPRQHGVALLCRRSPEPAPRGPREP